MARQITNHELSEIMRNNYTINSTNALVEEDSDYNISLVAVNSNISSPATVIMGTTKQAGISIMYVYTHMYVLRHVRLNF